MTMHCFRINRIGVWVIVLIIAACSPMHLPYKLRKAPPTTKLTASEQIAGEIMAYLMEVVLGKAGPMPMRQEWATRGSDLPLDFALVKERMFGPVPCAPN